MKIVFSRRAKKDYEKLRQSGVLFKKALQLLEVISLNPFQNPPAYEKLCGELSGAYSRRINGRHRLVYRVMAAEKEIWVISMWSHYE